MPIASSFSVLVFPSPDCTGARHSLAQHSLTISTQYMFLSTPNSLVLGEISVLLPLGLLANTKFIFIVSKKKKQKTFDYALPGTSVFLLHP